MKEKMVTSLKLEYEPGTIPEIFNLIEKLKSKLDRFQQQVLRETGLTPPQYNILNTLPDNSGYPLSQLATANHCSRSTMTSLIDIIERKNL